MAGQLVTSILDNLYNEEFENKENDLINSNVSFFQFHKKIVFYHSVISIILLLCLVEFVNHGSELVRPVTICRS